MSLALKDKLKNILYEKRLLPTQVEKMAGLKAHAVRNILSGRSQNPSVLTLKAISDVLGCSVEDILEGKPEIPTSFHSEKGNPPVEKERKPTPSFPIENPSLFLSSTSMLMQAVQEKGYTLTTDQAFKLIREVYVFASKKNLSAPDKDFTEWLIESQLEG